MVEDAHSNAFIRLPPATPQTEGSELDKSEVNAVTIAPESIKHQPPATPLNEGSGLTTPSRSGPDAPANRVSIRKLNYRRRRRLRAQLNAAATALEGRRNASAPYLMKILTWNVRGLNHPVKK